MTGNQDDGRVYLGLEIGGSKLQVCAGSGSGKILGRHRFSIDPAGGAVGIRQQLEKTLPLAAEQYRPVAAGVGFGGPVDWQTGRICCSHQVKGWSDFSLGPWVSTLLGAPVVVENDANVAALAEAVTGAGARHNPVFYVTLGSGVGGGLVVEGKIYHGAKPGESEIGHIRLDKSGVIIEELCSGWAVDRRLAAAAQAEPESALGRLMGATRGHEAKNFGAALAAHDAAAASILRELSDDLAFGLSHVTHLFHPEIIVLGGGLSLVGETLRAAVAQSLARYTMSAFAPGPKIALAAQGEDAVPVGALILARYLAGRP